MIDLVRKQSKNNTDGKKSFNNEDSSKQDINRLNQQFPIIPEHNEENNESQQVQPQPPQPMQPFGNPVVVGQPVYDGR
jgi:hypothetical protein